MTGLFLTASHATIKLNFESNTGWACVTLLISFFGSLGFQNNNDVPSEDKVLMAISFQLSKKFWCWSRSLIFLVAFPFIPTLVPLYVGYFLLSALVFKLVLNSFSFNSEFLFYFQELGLETDDKTALTGWFWFKIFFFVTWWWISFYNISPAQKFDVVCILVL